MDSKKPQNRKGAALIVVTMLFVVMMIFAYMTLNIANLQRNQVASQVSSDLASRWGVDLLSRTTNTRQVENQVRELAYRNWTVADVSPGGNWLRNNRNSIDVDIAIGTAVIKSDGITFKEGQRPYNSVRVSAGTQVPIVGFASRKLKNLKISRDATAIALERDICLVIDRSGSMNFDLTTGNWLYDNSRHSYNKMSTSRNSYLRRYSYSWWWYWPHPTKSRWSTMVPAMYGLADELNKTKQNEKFSIVSYSTNSASRCYDHNLRSRVFRYPAASTECDPTFDYQSAVEKVEQKYKYEHPVAGGTNISAGIEMGIQILSGNDSRPNAYKTMIVMTDGQFNDGREPWLAAIDAAGLGIEVFTVTFSEQADQQSMQTTAEDGNGRHFHAPNGDALEEVFREIANIPPAAYIN